MILKWTGTWNLLPARTSWALWGGYNTAAFSVKDKGRRKRGRHFVLVPSLQRGNRHPNQHQSWSKASTCTDPECKNSWQDHYNTLRTENICSLGSKALASQGTNVVLVTDTLKGIVCQPIQLGISMHTEKSLVLSCARFRATETLEQWLDLLAHAIVTLPRIYVIIDLKTVRTVHT